MLPFGPHPFRAARVSLNLVGVLMCWWFVVAENYGGVNYRVAGLQGEVYYLCLMPAALDINWDVIRVEFSHGATIVQLAERYGVNEGTLKKRSQRENWMSLRPETHATKVSPALIEGARLQGITLAERGQAYAARMFEKASKLAESANIKEVRSVKDLEIIDKIARRSAGLDTADVQINTVIGMGGMADDPILEAQTVDITPLPEESA